MVLYFERAMYRYKLHTMAAEALTHGFALPSACKTLAMSIHNSAYAAGQDALELKLHQTSEVMMEGK